MIHYNKYNIFQVLDREEQIDNPCPGWLTDIAWDNLTELDKYVHKEIYLYTVAAFFTQFFYF